MSVLKKALAPITGTGIFWPQDVSTSSMVSGRSLTGVSVSAQTAFGFTAFWAAVRAISEDIAKLPFIIYENLPDRAPGKPGGKRRAEDHPLYTVLHDQANPAMSAFTWRETSVAHLVSWGNCYSEIERNRQGDVVALWPLPPDRVRVLRDPDTDAKFYRFTLARADRNGQSIIDLDAHDVFHVPGLGYDGLVGYNPIDIMAKAIGLGLAAQEYGERFWANNARPGGILHIPYGTDLSKPARTRLKREFGAAHSGLSNAQRYAVLEDGVTFQEISMPNDTAQFLESRQFQVREVARAFRMPPHKIGDLDQATFSNIEQQALEYVTDCLAGWAGRIEAQVRKDLLARPFFAELLFDQLLRGDSLQRAKVYAIHRMQLGTMTPNIVADRENLPLRDDPGGDEYLVPLNMGLENAADGSSEGENIDLTLVTSRVAGVVAANDQGQPPGTTDLPPAEPSKEAAA